MSHSTFARGVHPDDSKLATEHLPIERMPLVDRYVLLLAQHIGAACKPVVAVGDRVRRGQLVAAPGGFVSVALHSPVTGKVTAIAERRHPSGAMVPAIEIELDPYDSQEMLTAPPVDPDSLDAKAFVAHVQQGGLVGLGGAAFPSHVKYALPEGRRVRELVLNGCECEPYLTSDHRVMVERAVDIMRGVSILGRKLGVERADVGVELNKADAIGALEAANQGAPGEFPVGVRPLEVKYPQGAEKMLIKALYDKEVPAGKLPLDLDIVVNNVSTMASLADWFDRGIPLVDRVVTVAGPAIGRPANLLVPIGTPIRAVLEYCGVETPSATQIVMGGPMMGLAVASIDAPVLKGTSGLLVFPDEDVHREEAGPCIRCGRCLEACALALNPSMFGRLARAGLVEEMDEWHVLDCMECGACTYVCPSHIPIVQLIRGAKTELRRQKKGGG